MSCFDCKKAVPHICKGDCCYVVPFDAILFESLKSKIITQPKRLLNLQGNLILPVTDGGRCCFLKDNFQCNIYKQRPQICKIYGIEEDLPCPHIDQSGKLRSKKNRKLMQDKINSSVAGKINSLIIRNMGLTE